MKHPKNKFDRRCKQEKGFGAGKSKSPLPVEAGDVQVSGTMTNNAGHNGLKLLVLVDKWFPITEEADAAP